MSATRAESLLAPAPRLGADVLDRIRRMAAQGWVCRLRPAHVRDIAAELDIWQEQLGLPGPAAARIRRAAKRCRGVILDAPECAAVVAAAARIEEA